MPKADTQFKPGESGNPGGRPKGIAKRAREMVDNDPVALLEVLLQIAQDEKAKATDRITATREILDRGWGKAAQHEAVKDGDPLELEDVDRAIATVLDELAPRREAKAPGPGANGKMAASGENGAA